MYLSITTIQLQNVLNISDELDNIVVILNNQNKSSIPSIIYKDTENEVTISNETTEDTKDTKDTEPTKPTESTKGNMVIARKLNF